MALLASVLSAAGLRVGSMPKPHLVEYRERIALDGRAVSEERFAGAVTRVLGAVERVAARLGEPTEFESLTAAGIVELARSRVDVALIEVGLGGRLDATNALDLGVAAITNVQHDHERHLGPTLVRIGTEKAAIIKHGNRAVTGASGRGLAPIIARCTDLAVPLRRVGSRNEYAASVREVAWDGVFVDVMRPQGPLEGLRVGLLGRHQAQNAAVAVAVVDALRERWESEGTAFPVDDAAVVKGLAAAQWPGRLEVVPADSLGLERVVLDGAHNPAGARVLRDALADLGVVRPVLVFGAMKGKRVAAMLRVLATLEPTVVFTRPPADTALAPAELATRWEGLTGASAATEDDPVAALRRAADLSRGRTVVVCGSLYLVGALRGFLLGSQAVA